MCLKERGNLIVLIFYLIMFRCLLVSVTEKYYFTMRIDEIPNEITSFAASWRFKTPHFRMTETQILLLTPHWH
jgi:hypothetical protein